MEPEKEQKEEEVVYDLREGSVWEDLIPEVLRFTQKHAVRFAGSYTADDVAQEVLFKLWEWSKRDPGRFTAIPRRQLFSLVSRMARNISVDRS